MPKADMVIYHAPDILEFVANGKTLGCYELCNAKPLFETIKCNVSFVGSCAVDELYRAMLRLYAHPNIANVGQS